MAANKSRKRSGFVVFWGVSMGSTARQPSNGLKLNRQPSKKVIFIVNRQKWRLRLTVKTFKVFQISLFQLISTEFWLLENFYTAKASSMHVLKNSISTHYNLIPYNLLISENISRFYTWKAKITFKTHQLILNHAQVNKIFTEIFGPNFHLITINHQKLWNLTISRQNWKN